MKTPRFILALLVPMMLLNLNCDVPQGMIETVRPKVEVHLVVRVLNKIDRNIPQANIPVYMDVRKTQYGTLSGINYQWIEISNAEGYAQNNFEIKYELNPKRVEGITLSASLEGHDANLGDEDRYQLSIHLPDEFKENEHVINDTLKLYVE